MLRPLAKCFTELGGTTGSLLRSVQAIVTMRPDGTYSLVGRGGRVARFLKIFFMTIKGFRELSSILIDVLDVDRADAFLPYPNDLHVIQCK